LSLSSAWLAPLNRGSLNSAHIHGTDVPVEEPSTASKAELTAPKCDFRYAPKADINGSPLHVPTGDIEMKEVAIECANYVFFLPPTLAMVASRVIGQLQRAYPHPGLTL
jgi:hypothetical protein